VLHQNLRKRDRVADKNQRVDILLATLLVLSITPVVSVSSV
jgi:hypothetical protein